MSEVIARLEEDNDFTTAAIYVSPPDNAGSDADSGDEDAGGTIDNLSGAQLRARAEMTVEINGEIHRTEDEIDSDETVQNAELPQDVNEVNKWEQK